MKYRTTLYVIAVVVVTIGALWLFTDATTFIHGWNPPRLFLEVVFNTSESSSDTMRLIQFITAIILGIVGNAIIIWLEWRSRRRQRLNEIAL